MHTSTQVKESKQYQALERHLSDQAALDETLNAFCEDVESKAQQSEDLGDPLWQAWRAVVTMASTISHASENRQKLVDFILALQERPPPSKDGKACVVQDAKVWAELPVFGMEMREAWNFGEGAFIPFPLTRYISNFVLTCYFSLQAATSDSTTEQQTMWLNLNAWTATLVASVQAQGKSIPDFSLYGIWTIRMALEEGSPSNIALQAAATWFSYASSSLYQMSLSGKQFDGKVAKPGWIFKDREWRGYSQNRWASWVRQMESHKTPVSDHEAGGVVADAVQAMKSADGASCARR